eukprot:scaffold38938_cov59-Attheya_sp.AAC.6
MVTRLTPGSHCGGQSGRVLDGEKCLSASSGRSSITEQRYSFYVLTTYYKLVSYCTVVLYRYVMIIDTSLHRRECNSYEEIAGGCACKGLAFKLACASCQGGCESGDDYGDHRLDLHLGRQDPTWIEACW